jgi:hypothetical protein
MWYQYKLAGPGEKQNPAIAELTAVEKTRQISGQPNNVAEFSAILVQKFKTKGP